MHTRTPTKDSRKRADYLVKNQPYFTADRNKTGRCRHPQRTHLSLWLLHAGWLPKAQRCPQGALLAHGSSSNHLPVALSVNSRFSRRPTAFGDLLGAPGCKAMREGCRGHKGT